MAEPLVSVCCLVYNHEPYLRECFDGFVMQKTTFPIEVLVHDDASTDKSADIIREYTAKYPDLFKPIYQTVNQYSQGIGVSFTYQFPRAQGKYIALCEGDDYWIDSLKLQKQVDFMEANIDYSGSVHQSMIRYMNCDLKDRLFANNVPHTITMNDLLRSRIFHTASVVIRTQCFSSLHEPPTVLSGDKVINLLMAATGLIGYMDDCMCVYRKNDGGVSSNVLRESIIKDLNIIPWISTIYPNFAKYRYKSFIYGTIAIYSTNISLKTGIYYLLLSFVLSFSYFPYNINDYFKKICHKIKIHER